MMSKSRSDRVEYWRDNVYKDIPTNQNEQELYNRFLASYDFSPHTVKAMIFDIRKFALYFTESNKEPFDSSRIATMDITSFRKHLREIKKQSVATVNRSLVLLRKYLDWLHKQGIIKSNPATVVKELHRQPLSPKGLQGKDVRKLIRETELRNDVRAKAVFSMFIFTGARVGDLIQIQLQDIIINDKSGYVIFRNGKGNKERTVPLPLPARKAIQEYLQIRPLVQSSILFQGERGDLTDVGVRSLCNKYSAICGIKIYPHLLRHTMAHTFLKDNNNDIVALAQILGHQNIQTTARYTQRGQDELSQLSDKMMY